MAPSTQVLPPGVGADEHSRFCDELAKLVGAENVSRDASTGALEGPHKQRTYGDPYPFTSADPHGASGAVRPESVEQVQAILRLANQFKIPMWTTSRGKNLGYGGAAPVLEGSMVLDLHRMTRIIEISEADGYAVVEPGVSFFDLYEEIKRRGLALWPSVPAIGWGSVVGNTLDRGFGYTPNGEHTQSQCGMEVVLPSGELMRTGMGAMEGSALSPLYKPPSVDGLFFQSNLGVVTKLGLHLTPAPESYVACALSVPNEEDLEHMVTLLADLMRRGVIANNPTVSNLFRQAVMTTDPEVMASLGPHLGPNKQIPEPLLYELKAKYGWGFWKAEFGLYGCAEVVPALERALRRNVEKINGAQLVTKTWGGVPGKYLKSEDVEEVIPHTGIPTLSPLALMEYRMRPGTGHTCFSPLIPTSGPAMYQWYLAAKKMTAEAKFDSFADFHIWPRYSIAINLFVFAPEEKEKASQLYLDLLKDGTERGLSEYRTHVSFMDLVKTHYNFNDGALGKFTDTLKDSLDPNNILSPGKSGIWGTKSTYGRAPSHL
ncbi:FAD-linked oxidase-like protein [Xylariaceae sp. FL0016]|nr:FAD-linked oxidase-like protein [Xylariaceae sp. FL0016]